MNVWEIKESRLAPRASPWALATADPERVALWLFIAAAAMIVAPPFFFLAQSSLLVPQAGFRTIFGFGNYTHVLETGSLGVWLTTFEYAIGAAACAIAVGFSVAWVVARTNAPLQGMVFAAAFLSMATPLLVKDIGWILLLGPNNGIVNVWLRARFGGQATIELFSLGGMMVIEGLLLAPVAFLLALSPLAALDPGLEEAAAVSGAGRLTTLRRIVLPLATPTIVAILLLSFVRALESFETPLLIGMPGGIRTTTTALYESIHAGFLPRYGDASAYAVLLVLVVAAPLALYYRVTRDASRYATLGGRGFRGARIDLGRWRWPCALWTTIIPLSLVAPLLLIVWISFQPAYTGQPLAGLGRMSMANYAAIWSRDDARTGLLNSLGVAAASATFVCVFGMATGWLVARRREKARWILDAICSAPLAFPGIALGVAILVLSLRLRVLPIYGTLLVIAVAFVVKFLPYGVRFCHAGVLSIGAELEDGAQTCGASRATILRRIVLPLALPSVLAAWTYVFIYAVRDLSTIVLLSSPGNLLVSMVVLDQWNNGETPRLAALSTLVTLATAAVAFVLLQLTRGRRFDP